MAKEKTRADYFGEKSFQVQPGDLVAFGVRISSRYHRADEIIDMLRFAGQLAERDVAHYVVSVFCDSQACVFSFELADAVIEGDPVADAIFAAARETLSAFMWFDEWTEGKTACDDIDDDGDDEDLARDEAWKRRN